MNTSLEVDPSKASIIREFQLPRAPGYCRYSFSGKCLFAGCEDNEIHLWNGDTNELNSLKGHDSWVRGFEFFDSDNQFISSGYDGNLIWWQWQAGEYQAVHRRQAHAGWIRSIALSPNQQQLASAGNDRMIRIWSVPDRMLISELSGHQQPICSLAFHPAGDRLASADHIGVIKDWDLSSARLVRELDGSATHFSNKGNRGTSGGLRSLLFTSNGQFLVGSGVVGGGDPLGQAVNPGGIVFDWNLGQRKTLLKAKGNELGVAWGMVYHPTSHFVSAISGGMSAKHVYFWKVSDEQPFYSIELPSPGRSLTLHPDGTQLAVALHDGKVQIYSLT